jgi:hypothetical protein
VSLILSVRSRDSYVNSFRLNSWIHKDPKKVAMSKFQEVLRSLKSFGLKTKALAI